LHNNNQLNLMISRPELYITGRLFLVIYISLIASVSFSQDNDTSKSTYKFGGAISVKNNGISLIPNLTLGEHAFGFRFYKSIECPCESSQQSSKGNHTENDNSNYCRANFTGINNITQAQPLECIRDSFCTRFYRSNTFQ